MDIKRGIIRKLFYLGKWGHNHTSFDNIPKGFPKELGKEVKSVAKDLIKGGILLSKPTSYGVEVSLNPAKKGDIENILGI
ncbi:unnamed protein product [marine sediment metagenome]|uniref:Uncharacterized protein n=1 Tax=marine sediment metagenome TaxID=412755 RepID=X0WH33_9ZZZZ